MIGREDGCSGHAEGACVDLGHREILVMTQASLVRSVPKPRWSREVDDGGYEREEARRLQHPSRCW